MHKTPSVKNKSGLKTKISYSSCLYPINLKFYSVDCLPLLSSSYS